MTLTATDLFCGAGGSSLGAESTGRVKVEIAANHSTPIPGYPGYSATADATIIGRSGRPMRPHAVPGGYLRIAVVDEHGNRVNRLVHVLVARTFLGPCPTGHQVNHRNGDTSDNRIENLEYVTPSENVRHSLDVLGRTRAPGEANGNALLTEVDVKAMRCLRESGVPCPTIGILWDIDPTHAWRVVTGRSWKHVA